MTIPPPPLPPAIAVEPAPAPRRPSWWRRNAVALVALAVLAPVTAAAVGWQEWYQYFGFGARAVTAITVDEDASADLAGAEWGPVRGGEIDDVSGLDVPDGTRLIAVAVPVDASTAGIGCETPKLVERATGREWRPVRLEIGLLSDPDEPETCLSAEAGEYELVVPFVVPDDAEGPFWVDVRPYDAGGSFLRFAFEL
ncbi:hypothetical protein [Microbacterium sp. K41]|uniref:hypothetical protein n=1 Tax=Microbacterium sp. K41 TaxID=2305437 RepID=UPI00109D2CF7|nr:hypothetical protein [Microbacterium sp. K41]